MKMSGEHVCGQGAPMTAFLVRRFTTSTGSPIMPERARKYHVVRFDNELVATEITVRLLETVERAIAMGVRFADGIVVWTSSPWSTDRELFLSDAALRLAQQAGLELPVNREIDRGDLPRLKALLIDAMDAR
jgi:hypothetical protein